MPRTDNMDQSILIIDGHPVYAQKTEGFLRGLTFQNIQIAATGKEALESVRRRKPGLVILSSMLQDMESLEVCRAVHELMGASSRIIVQVGLFTTADMVSQFNDRGADVVLMRKEKDLAPLQSAIESLLPQGA